MARRWRIRHKLMLGLATAVGILALLVAGTINGLWSYYVTIKSIESKLEELDQAEVLKSAVTALAGPSGEDLVKEDGLEDDFPKQTTTLHRVTIPAAEKALDEFEKSFQKTLNRELPADDGTQAKGLIKGLRKLFAELHDLCDVSSQTQGVRIVLPRERYGELRKQVIAKIGEIELASNDLRGGIREILKTRIISSKDNHRLTLIALICISTLGIVLMVSACRFFLSWIFNPIRDLQGGVCRVAEGDFEHRIEVHSGDEMEELASQFNDMTSRLHDLYRDMTTQINERSRQLVRSERLASVGFLAAGVAHEINNPLASIAFCSEALEARLDQLREESGGQELEVFTKYLRMIQEEAFRCKKITERLLEVSRNSENKRERIDLAVLVQSVLEVTQHHPKSKNKDIIFQPAGPVYAWACVEEIKSVVINLLFNSLESMDDGGRLSIELRQRDGMAELLFRDNGCGMTQEVLENIFEPFFTRSRSGKGTGLGLTITHKIVSQHGGEIEADSPGADQGSTFRVRLPMQPTEASREETLGHNAAA